MKILLLFAILAASVTLILGARDNLHKNGETKEAEKKELLKNKLRELLKATIANEKKGVNDHPTQVEKVAADGNAEGPAKTHSKEKLRAMIKNMKRRKFLARRRHLGTPDKNPTGTPNAKRNQKLKRRQKLRKSKNLRSVVGKKISNGSGKVGKKEQLRRMKTYFSKRAEAIGKKANTKGGAAEKRQYDQYGQYDDYYQSYEPTCGDCYTMYMSEGPYDDGFYDTNYDVYGMSYDYNYYDDDSHDSHDSNDGTTEGYYGNNGYYGTNGENHGTTNSYYGTNDGYYGNNGYYGTNGENHGTTNSYYGTNDGNYDTIYGNYDTTYGNYDGGYDYNYDDYYVQCSRMLYDETCGEPSSDIATFNGSCEIPCYFNPDEDFEWCVMQELSDMYHSYTVSYQPSEIDELDCKITNLFKEIYVRMQTWMNYGDDYYGNDYGYYNNYY